MINRFSISVIIACYLAVIFTVELQTDIRVYKAAYDNGIYLSDIGFEAMQTAFKLLNLPFEALQVLLLVMSVLVIKFTKVNSHAMKYLIGPVVFIGIFNSIRQSIAVTSIFIAIELFHYARSIKGIVSLFYLVTALFLSIVALSFHKGAIFIPVFYLGVYLIKLLIVGKIHIFELAVSFFVFVIMFLNVDWFISTFTRYKGYFDTNNVFERGVLSSLKIYFWWFSLFVDYHFYQRLSEKKTEYLSFIGFKIFFLSVITSANFLGAISFELVSRMLLLYMYFTILFIMRNDLIRSNYYYLIYIFSPSTLGLAWAILMYS